MSSRRTSVPGEGLRGKKPDRIKEEISSVQGPEVFESPDYEERERLPLAERRREQLETEDIRENLIQKPLAPIQAFEVFAGKRFETSSSDFSESVHRTYRMQGGAPVIRTSDGEDQIPETPKEKFERLRAELTGLVQELEERKEQAIEASESNQNQNENDQNQNQNLSDVRALQQQLSSLLKSDSNRRVMDPLWESLVPDSTEVLHQLTQRLVAEVSRVGPPGSSTTMDPLPEEKVQLIVREVLRQAESQQQHKHAKALDLEKRLSQLEKTYGTSSTLSNVGDVHAMLQTSEQKLSLLDAKALETLGKRVGTLNYELEKAVAAKAKIAGPDDRSENVDKVFSAVNRWDVVAQQVPVIISRLQSLKKVHDEAEQFVTTLKEIEGQQKDLVSIVHNHDGLLKQVEENFKTNLSKIQTNLEGFDKRIEGLAQKVKVLQQQ